MRAQPTFFDCAAEVGLTKHIGGLKATDRLIELCHIHEASFVLDVGCGVGMTPVYLAKKCRCRVLAVDISERMVERARERVTRERLREMVDVRVADAQDLPLGHDTFDAVITESVTSFPQDKQRAVNEYVRVTRPGGHVGLNESVWLKVPPPPEVVAWAAQDVDASVQPLSPGEWVDCSNVLD